MRICSVYGHTPEDREDLFQEIILAVWKSLPDFKQQSAVHTWIYRIALNVSIRHARKERAEYSKRKKKQYEDMICRNEDTDDVEGRLERKEMLKFIQHFLTSLKEPDRTVMLLYLEDFTGEVISEIVGISVNAVSVRIHRVKKRLLREMEEKGLRWKIPK